MDEVTNAVCVNILYYANVSSKELIAIYQDIFTKHPSLYTQS